MPERNAHTQVYRAVRAGRLAKLDGSVPCVDCGKPASGYDHRDYDKPLDVEAVCRGCNKRRGTAKNVIGLPPPPSWKSEWAEFGVSVLGCTRCNHQWLPRSTQPMRCPNCHSPLWNRKAAKK